MHIHYPHKLIGAVALAFHLASSGFPGFLENPAGLAGMEEMPAGKGEFLVLVIKSREIYPYEAALAGFYRELEEERRWIRTRVMTLEGDGARPEAFLARIQKASPDAIVTLGTAATRTLVEGIRDIPIIFSLVLLSSSQDLLEGAREAGVPITGVAMDIPVRLQFEKARELLPDLRRIGVFFNPEETGHVVEEATRVAGELGLVLVGIPVRSEVELQARLEGPWPDVDLLWSVADSTVFTPRSAKEILLHTLRRQVPFIGLSPSFVKAGALLSFSCDYEEVGAQAARMAWKVLLGEPAGSLPVTTPKDVSYYLNMKTAKKIGLVVPREVRDKAEVLF